MKKDFGERKELDEQGRENYKRERVSDEEK